MPVYDLQDRGVVLGGDPRNAATNTDIIQRTFQTAKSIPGPIELAMGGPAAVLNGKLILDAPNMVLRGLAGMGTVPGWGPTSTLKGFGIGDTLKVVQAGCKVNGLAWLGDGQKDDDCFLRITATQVEVFDHYMESPNIGIKVQFPFMTGGQFWFRNILMGGIFKKAGMDISAGQSAVKLDHIRMFNGTMDPSSPQPPYGVLLKSAGEFIMLGACDICNCGCNLAIVPGISGYSDGDPNKWEYVGAIAISDTLFDNGNGDQMLIRPMGSSFVGDIALSNIRSCSINNNDGKWPGNAFTLDGSQSRPKLNVAPIMNVSMVNCFGMNALKHCGLYANNVIGLGVSNCTFGGNHQGIQTNHCTGTFTGNKLGAYVFPPLRTASAGNTQWGMLLESSQIAVATDNIFSGNGLGPIHVF